VLLGFAVAVPIASLLLSGSRGGFLALLVEIVVFTAILWSSIRNPQSAIRNRQLRIPHSSLPLAVALALLSAALLFFWMDPGNISRRLATVFGVGVSYDELVAERREASLGALRIFGAHPGLGAGLGSFEMVFPRYRRTPSDLLWDHAHNDYAEALAETGLVGALLILWSLVLFFNSALRTHHSSLVTRHSSLNFPGTWHLTPDTWLRLGATLGCIGLLVHSFSDFNLRIPANAAWFAFCAAIAVAGRPPVASRQPQASV
jgi:O-antigen ligase